MWIAPEPLDAAASCDVLLPESAALFTADPAPTPLTLLVAMGVLVVV